MNPTEFLCFLLEETTEVEVRLRRHASGKCPTYGGHYHNASMVIGREKFASHMTLYPTSNGPISLEDPRWPLQCEHCLHVFKDTDVKQYVTDHLYQRSDTGERLRLRDAPVGAMWYAESFNDWYANQRGPDGRSLIVKTPGGDWCVDSRASNCDSPCVNCGVPYKDHTLAGCNAYADAQPEHKCWVRHGTAPLITVDKNGHTCGAGAGSIQAGHWHGFLRGGRLLP